MARKSLKQRAKKIKLTKQYRGGYKGSDGKTYTDSEGLNLLATHQATLASWHSGKRKDSESYEGGQYYGGRKEGRKNLKRTERGTFINEHGVEFTQAEKKALESAVNTANRKRMRMLNEEGELPRLNAGKETGQKVANLQAMGKESDFILARKSKSLQRFHTKEEYYRYLDNLKRVNSRGYIKERTELYRSNHIKALENVFGDDAKDVIAKIEKMKLKDYRKLLQQDEIMEVNYVYDPSALQGKLNQIRAALGMDLQEESVDIHS